TALKSDVASRKFENLGQRDDGALSAVATAVDFHKVLGAENVEARVVELATALKEGLAKIKRIELVTPMDPKFSGGVVISQLAAPDREKTGALVKDLYEKHGIGGAATGGLRLCPHVYNTMADIDAALRGVRALVG